MLDPWKVNVSIKGVMALVGAATGVLPVQKSIDDSVQNGPGEGTGTAHSLHTHELSIAASSNDDIDLRAQLRDGPIQAVTDLGVTWTEVSMVIIEADADNDDAVTLTASTTNGWDVLLGSDGTVVLQPGDFLVRRTVMALDATHKAINAANASSTDAAILRFTMLGH